MADSTRELGVRIALGAGPHQVLALVARRGLRVLATGVAFGLVLALAAGRLVATLLYGVSPVDPFAIGAAAALVGLASALANIGPLRRAVSVDPVTSLRSS